MKTAHTLESISRNLGERYFTVRLINRAARKTGQPLYAAVPMEV